MQKWLTARTWIFGIGALLLISGRPAGAAEPFFFIQLSDPQFGMFTTNKEFASTLDLMFGGTTGLEDSGNIDDLLGTLDEDAEGEVAGGEDVVSAAADNELVKLVNKVIIDAYNQKVSDIHIEPMPGKFKTGIRFRIDGVLTLALDPLRILAELTTTGIFLGATSFFDTGAGLIDIGLARLIQQHRDHFVHGGWHHHRDRLGATGRSHRKCGRSLENGDIDARPKRV